MTQSVIQNSPFVFTGLTLLTGKVWVEPSAACWLSAVGWRVEPAQAIMHIVIF
jgi:hypothetical protein